MGDFTLYYEPRTTLNEALRNLNLGADHSTSEGGGGGGGMGDLV